MNLLFFSAKGKSLFSVDCQSLFSLADQIFHSIFKKKMEKWGKQSSPKIILALEARHPIEVLIFFKLWKRIGLDALLLSPNRSVDELVGDCFKSLVGKQQVVLLVLGSWGDRAREGQWRMQKKRTSGSRLSIELISSFKKLIVEAWAKKKQDHAFFGESFSTGCEDDFLYRDEKKNAFGKGRLLFFTSGSSSEPKLVVFEKKNINDAIALQNKNFPFVGSDRWALTLPLHHVSGLSIVFRSLLGGGSISFFCQPSDEARLQSLKKNSHGEEGLKKEFISALLDVDCDKKPSLKALKNAKTSHLSVSVYQLSHYVLQAQNNKSGTGVLDEKKSQALVDFFLAWPFLKLVLVGGGPIPDWVWKICLYEKHLRKKMTTSFLPQMDKWFNAPVLRPTYGMSESFAQLATWNGVDEINCLRLLKGRIVKKGKNDSLVINKFSCFSGYMVGGRVLQLRNQWWECDDLVELRKMDALSSADKKDSSLPALIVLGKKSNVVISGGENVSVEELEQKLLSSNFFSRLVVLGLPHDAWGEEIVCLCSLKDDALLEGCGGKKSLIEKRFYQPLFKKVLSSLEKYKRPKKYFLWNANAHLSNADALDKLPRGRLRQQVTEGVFPLFFSVDG